MSTDRYWVLAVVPLLREGSAEADVELAVELIAKPGVCFMLQVNHRGDMERDETAAVKAVLRKGIADTVLRLSKLDADPIRDGGIIAEAVLSALSSAGYKVVRDNA